MKPDELDMEIIADGSQELNQEIGRTIFEKYSDLSEEDLDSYLSRREENANIFYALASKFGLAELFLPK